MGTLDMMNGWGEGPPGETTLTHLHTLTCMHLYSHAEIFLWAKCDIP